MRERFSPKAFPLLPFLALSAALVVAGEIVYHYQVTVGLAMFALGIIPIALTVLVTLIFKPLVRVRAEGVNWRYLWGQEFVAWSDLRRIGRANHPAGGFRLYAEVTAESFQTRPMGRVRRGLAGPSGAGQADIVRVWLPVSKLMRFCRVGSTRYLPAALRRLNPTLEMSERGLDGAWGRYRIVVPTIIAVWLAVIAVLGLL